MELAVRERDASVQPASDTHGERFKWGLDRFMAEAQTLARFKHPNIVRVLAVFEANGTGYMVMEYEHGDTLHEILTRRQTLEEDELLDIVLPILGGLEKVHERGFIHRDIKPANIFIREDGSPVLIDFGSARQVLGAETRALTTSGPAMRLSEQYFSKGEQQGPWTDIYGLGATLFRAVTGQRPQDAVDRSRAILEAARDTLGDVGGKNGPLLGALPQGHRSRAAVPPEGPAADCRGVAPGIRCPAGRPAEGQTPGQRRDGHHDRRRRAPQRTDTPGGAPRGAARHPGRATRGHRHGPEDHGRRAAGSAPAGPAHVVAGKAPHVEPADGGRDGKIVAEKRRSESVPPIRRPLRGAAQAGCVRPWPGRCRRRWNCPSGHISTPPRRRAGRWHRSPPAKGRRMTSPPFWHRRRPTSQPCG